MRTGYMGTLKKLQWFLAKKSHIVPVDGVLLKDKALDSGKQLGHPYFKAPGCCQSNWKTRLVQLLCLFA